MKGIAMEEHEDSTLVPTGWIRDQALSRRARGLLLELLSHGTATTSLDELVKSGPEGRDAIRTALEELEKRGYLTREIIRENRRFAGARYTVHEPEAGA